MDLHFPLLRMAQQHASFQLHISRALTFRPCRCLITESALSEEPAPLDSIRSLKESLTSGYRPRTSSVLHASLSCFTGLKLSKYQQKRKKRAISKTYCENSVTSPCMLIHIGIIFVVVHLNAVLWAHYVSWIFKTFLLPCSYQCHLGSRDTVSKASFTCGIGLSHNLPHFCP